MSGINLGLGVMIRMLAGQRGVDMQKIADVEIANVTIADDALTFTFADGAVLRLSDQGQSCCESRYMRTDDTLADFIGATIQNFEIANGPEQPESEYGEVHDIQFLRVLTSKGVLTCSNHNEHNGYYGGFSIEADYTPGPNARVSAVERTR